MIRRGVALALGALALSATEGAAQRISGTLSLPAGGSRTGGIVIVAKDSAGVEVVRAATAEDGRYALALPRPGYAKVEVLRVGYQSQTILDRVIAPSEAVPLNVELTNVHAELPQRGTTPPSSCNPGPDVRYVDVMFEEVRKALLATQVGLARPGVVGRWATTDHRLGPNQRDTTRYSIARKSGALLAAFGSPVLGELQRSGFVVSAGQDRIFRGLDVPALLSSWFRESYCFTAIEGSPTTFALQFVPKVRRRDYVDITGEIVIARATLELLSVKYEYVGLPADEDKRGAGGAIAFGRTDGGSWLVTDWSIKFPQMGVIELQTFRSADRGRVLNPEVVGIEWLGGYTTALMEGTRRVYSREIGITDGRAYAPAIRTACGERLVSESTGAAKGRLTFENRPVSGSRIRATWRTQVDVGGEIPLWRDEIRETTSNNRGEWTLCDLPHDMTVELSWEVQGRRSATELKVRRDQLVTVGPDGRVIEGAQP